MQIVDRLAGVLLQMDTLDADNTLFTLVGFDGERAFADDRVIQLTDLVPLRQIGVEVILPVEARPVVDLRAQGQAGANRLPHAFAVEHRQHPRHRRIDKADLRSGFGAERRRGARKQFRLRRHLGMDFQPDDDLPIAGGALDAKAAAAAVVGVSHARLLALCRALGKLH